MNYHQMSPTKHPLAGLGRTHLPSGPGVYLLFHTNIGAPAFVGRADSSLFEALRAHVGSSIYKYFKFMACKDRSDAYQWECIFWHKSQASLDHSEARGGHHPRAPRGVDVRCPLPGCTHNDHTHEPSHHPAEEVHSASE